MSNDNHLPVSGSAVSGDQTKLRKKYKQPSLAFLGDLRSVTLGPSAMGNNDSGFSGAWNGPQRLPPGMPGSNGDPFGPGGLTPPG